MKSLLIFTGIFLFMVIACRKVDDKANWDVDLYGPIFKTSLSLNDMLNDSLIEENSDQSISLVYKNELFSIGVDSLLKLPNKSIQKSFTIQNLVIDNNTIEYSMTLADIARQQGGLVGALLLSNHGNTIPVTAMSGLSSSPFDIDATTYFQDMILSEGKIDVTIENQLPIDCDSIIYNFKNKNIGNIIIQDTFEYIPSGGSNTHTFLLDTTQLEGELLAELINFNTPGAPTGALIDTNDAIKISVKIYDLKLESATAYFPTQNLVNDSNNIEIEGLTAELTQATTKSGQLIVEVISTAEDTIYFEYSLPDVTKNGACFSETDKLDPAPPNDTTHLFINYPMDDYNFDLTGKNKDTFNTFYSTMVASLKESGKLISISKEDSFILNFTFDQLIPKYIKGYFGMDTIDIPQASTSTDIFEMIESGNVEFEDLEVEIEIENSLGVDGSIELQNLSASNTQTSQSISLSNSIINSNINIVRATENPIQPTSSVHLLNSSNSNIVSMLNLMPNQLGYSGQILINPNGNTSGHQDFATDESRVKASLNINIPLSLISNNLTLSSESDFSINDTSNSNSIKEGTFILNAENGYPLDANIELSFLDQTGVVATLSSSQNIEAADLNGLGKVDHPKSSRIEYKISESQMQNIINAQTLKTIISYNTKPENQFVKIYSDYKITLQLIADFKYHYTLK